MNQQNHLVHLCGLPAQQKRARSTRAVNTRTILTIIPKTIESRHNILSSILKTQESNTRTILTIILKTQESRQNTLLIIPKTQKVTPEQYSQL